MLKKLLLILACSLGVMALSPDDAQAHGPMLPVYRYLSVDVGWEGMLLEDGIYESNNSGIMLTLSGGISFLFMGGIGLEQDLGYIHLAPAHSLRDYGMKGERLFKGATIVSFPLMLAFPESGGFGVQLRPGIGAVYMQTPDHSKKSAQAWFAFRLALGGIAYVNDQVGLGIDFEYTLQAADGNVFDGEDIVNSVSLKAKVMFDFSDL